MRLNIARAFPLMLFALFLLVEHAEAAFLAPSSFTATPVSSSQINLSWIDNTSNETGFRVMRAPTSTGPWSQIVITGANVTSYANSGLSASTTYYYRVGARNAAGSASYSNTANATTLSIGTILPNAPTSLSASAASSTQINLSWIDRSSNEAGFKVERAATSAGLWSQIATTGANVTAYSNTGLSASTTYYYRVRASNAAGNSSYSNTASATTSAAADTTAPSVPTSLTASAVSCSQNNLAWASSTDNAGGSGLKGYNVYKNGAFLKQVPAPATSTSDSGLTASTAFSYTVSAVDQVNNESARSAAAIATTPACPVTQAVWAEAIGNTQDDRGRSVAIDQFGNTVLTGHFRQTVDFGGGPLTAKIYCLLGVCNPGYPSDIFLAKSTPTGVPLWSKRIGGHGDDSGSAVAVDSHGDVLVTGTIGPNVDLGGGEFPYSSGYDIIVAKYSGVDGGYRWGLRIGSAGNDIYSYGIAADHRGDVVVTGQFLGTVDFGNGPLTSAGSWDIFVAKYSGLDGSALWSRRMGGAQDNTGLGVAVDSLGDVVVTGYSYGTADFGGPAPLTSAGGSSDIFLAKYRAYDGAYLWAMQIGNTSYDLAKAVAVDSGDNILLTGQFAGTVNFGGPGSLSGGFGDAFVAKYTSSGAYLWAQRFGGTNGDWGTALAVDGSDNIAVTGALQGTVDFGNGPLTSAGSFDMFVLKLPPAGGTPLWSKRFGSTGDDRGNLGLAAGLDGSTVVTGYFPGTVVFGDGPLTSAGKGDIFLLHIEPE